MFCSTILYSSAGECILNMLFNEIVWEFIGLFGIAFLSATLLPLGSELVLLGVVLHHPQLNALALAVATCGNALGGMTNWYLGRYLLQFQAHKWFPVSPVKLEQMHSLFQRYGQLSLLFSWLPAIGDALCLAAGIAKLHWCKALLWITLGKGLRYGVLVFGTKTLVLS